VIPKASDILGAAYRFRSMRLEDGNGGQHGLLDSRKGTARRAPARSVLPTRCSTLCYGAELGAARRKHKGNRRAASARSPLLGSGFLDISVNLPQQFASRLRDRNPATENFVAVYFVAVHGFVAALIGLHHGAVQAYSGKNALGS
jgi:hypothetical protein